MDMMVLVNTSTVMVSLFQTTHASKYTFTEKHLECSSTVWGLKGMKCDRLMSDKHVAEPACND